MSSEPIPHQLSITVFNSCWVNAIVSLLVGDEKLYETARPVVLLSRYSFAHVDMSAYTALWARNAYVGTGKPSIGAACPGDGSADPV